MNASWTRREGTPPDIHPQVSSIARSDDRVGCVVLSNGSPPPRLSAGSTRATLDARQITMPTTATPARTGVARLRSRLRRDRPGVARPPARLHALAVVSATLLSHVVLEACGVSREGGKQPPGGLARFPSVLVHTATISLSFRHWMNRRAG
jgi:hypothetical protein